MINSESVNECFSQSFSHENVWSSLAFEFKIFEYEILNTLFDESLGQNQAGDEFHISKSLEIKEKFKKEISKFESEMKKKLCKIIFQYSVAKFQSHQKQRQMFQMERKSIQQRQNNEGKIKDLQTKLQSLGKLVKVYEKALSQTKNPYVLSNPPIPCGITLVTDSAKQIPTEVNQKKSSFKFDRIYSIKIQNDDQKKSVSDSKLSQSRLSQSRLSGGRLESGVLKQLEKNWNKSVNISSKNLRSGNKELQRSIQKEQKSFVKSHIKQRDINLSSIKQNKTPAKIRKQRKLNQSTITEFCLVKN